MTVELKKQLEKTIRIFRLTLDIKFIERLIKTQQTTLAKEYVTKLKEHLEVIKHT